MGSRQGGTSVDHYYHCDYHCDRNDHCVRLQHSMSHSEYCMIMLVICCLRIPIFRMG